MLDGNPNGSAGQIYSSVGGISWDKSGLSLPNASSHQTPSVIASTFNIAPPTVLSVSSRTFLTLQQPSTSAQPAPKRTTTSDSSRRRNVILIYNNQDVNDVNTYKGRNESNKRKSDSESGGSGKRVRKWKAIESDSDDSERKREPKGKKTANHRIKSSKKTAQDTENKDSLAVSKLLYGVCVCVCVCVWVCV